MRKEQLAKNTEIQAAEIEHQIATLKKQLAQIKDAEAAKAKQINKTSISLKGKTKMEREVMTQVLTTMMKLNPPKGKLKILLGEDSFDLEGDAEGIAWAKEIVEAMLKQ